MTPPEYRFSVADASGWIGVEGGGLQQPVEVRVRLSGATMRIVGLRIDGDHEVTSFTLRSIRPGALAVQLQQYLRDELLQSEGLTEHWKTVLEKVDPVRLQADPERWTGAEEMFVELAAVEERRDQLRALLEATGDDAEFRARTRGATPPTDDDYRRFAVVYLDELTRGTRGAKSRTARRVGMNRGTAYRWTRECQNRGLIPTEET